MRSELRKQVPHLGGCGPAIILGAAVLAVVGGFFLWKWVQNSPTKMVQAAMRAAHRDGAAGLRPFLTPESSLGPSAEQWTGQLVQVFRTTAVLKNEEVTGDEATVHVLIVQRPGGGVDATSDLGVKTVRSPERGWLIDLPATIASVTPQFWQSLPAAPG